MPQGHSHETTELKLLFLSEGVILACEPIRLARSRGVSPVELRRIEVVVFEKQQFFKEKWYEFFRK